jgi:hypothetical protein
MVEGLDHEYDAAQRAAGRVERITAAGRRVLAITHLGAARAPVNDLSGGEQG